MIDLIKEINENKFKRGDNYTDFKRGFNRGIVVCEEILDQYNIITAPKEIKLNEIVDRLKETHILNNSKISICRHNNKIDVWEDYEISDIEDEKCSGSKFLLSIDNQNKVDLIGRDFTSEKHKWLYTLWIAGTTIIDDLEDSK